jgi:hypothetical protein
VTQKCVICSSNDPNCLYCAGFHREGRLYSYDDDEERRLWAIRNEPGSRAKAIARSRVGKFSGPIHPVELTWLKEEFMGNIPFLSSQEWDVLMQMVLHEVPQKAIDKRHEKLMKRMKKEKGR